jgi:hypothetical protein
MLCLESLVYTLVLAFWAYDEYFIVGRRNTQTEIMIRIISNYVDIFDVK